MNAITLQTQADSASNELDELKRHVAVAKDEIRAALEKLSKHTAYGSPGDETRAIEQLFEAIDEFAYDDMSAIKGRFNEADEAISNIEERQLFNARPIP